jgi:hypothetical protein
VHEIVTAVMVELLEPPLHATIPRRAETARIRARKRKSVPQTVRKQHEYFTANKYLTDNPLA